MMKKSFIAFGFLLFCACTSKVSFPHSKIPDDWKYFSFEKEWGIEFLMPPEVKIENSGPAGYEVFLDNYNEKNGVYTNEKIAFTLNQAKGGFPENFFNTEKGCPSGISAKKNWILEEEYKKIGFIECASGKRYFIITSSRVFGIQPTSQSKQELEIIEKILLSTKITITDPQ